MATRAGQIGAVLEGTAQRLKRRGLMAAVAAVVGGLMARSSATTAMANTGDDLVIGVVNSGKSQTTLNTTGAGPNEAGFRVFNDGGGAALQGVAQAKAGSPFSAPGVRGDSDTSPAVEGVSTAGVGVRGVSSSTSDGVRGEANSGVGVHGISTSGVGVRGDTVSSDGVSGTSQTGSGVSGSSQTGSGVSGTSAQGVGIRGIADAIGVRGESKDGSGVRGDSITSSGVLGTSQVGFGVMGTAKGVNTPGVPGFAAGIMGKAGPGAAAAIFQGGPVLVQGDFVVGPGFAKNVAVEFPDGSTHVMYCVESPDNVFVDYGEAALTRGRAEVRVAEDFAKTVDLSKPYFVFVTPNDPRVKALGVVERHPDHFVVEDQGGGEGRFSYMIVGKRASFRGERLARVTLPPPVPDPPPPPRERSLLPSGR